MGAAGADPYVGAFIGAGMGAGPGIGAGVGMGAGRGAVCCCGKAVGAYASVIGICGIGAPPGDSIVGATPGPGGGATGAPHTMHAVAPSNRGRLQTAQFIGRSR
jgi:hypothetical protein